MVEGDSIAPFYCRWLRRKYQSRFLGFDAVFVAVLGGDEGVLVWCLLFGGGVVGWNVFRNGMSATIPMFLNLSKRMIDRQFCRLESWKLPSLSESSSAPVTSLGPDTKEDRAAFYGRAPECPASPHFVSWISESQTVWASNCVRVSFFSVCGQPERGPSPRNFVEVGQSA